MPDKEWFIQLLIEEFNSWEALLSSLSEAQITARPLPGGMSIKDTMAHLWAWQQRSIARLNAALEGGEPAFPRWVEGLEPDAHENTDQINAWIDASNRDRPWSAVYQDWRAGFQQLLELSEAIPERDLLHVGRYSWLPEHPLSFILQATYEHHHDDHLEPLIAWLDKHSGAPLAATPEDPVQ